MTTNFFDDAGATILINKPLHWTSFDVVRKLRNILKVKKVGHAGTLDPLATGLLILCTNNKTKEIERYQNLDKTYQGTICIGKTTPSFDLETDFDQIKSYEHITEEEVCQTAKKFVGTIEQLPPMYSAAKVQGKRLYKLARKGKTVDLSPKTVYIKSFDIIDIQLPYITFKVECSKGTYIRSLADSYGKKLKNVGAHLTALQRTHIGEYSLHDAYEINEIEERVKDGGRTRDLWHHKPAL
jgi:tRNA pseudouridine55 synthase